MKIFRCNIPHLDTAIIGQMNGWYVSKDVPLIRLGKRDDPGKPCTGIQRIPRDYRAALRKIFRSTGKNVDFTDLNTAFAQDGIFIYVPDNVHSPETHTADQRNTAR
jgi:Fe-S cluster assembly protein SufD